MGPITKIAVVGIGGGVGAIARYLINISPLASIFDKFPLATFLINILGCFAIGFLIVAFAEHYAESEALRLALIVGFLGAFTTFSTFESEIYGLAREREVLIAIAYLMLSVAVGFIAVAAGVILARKIA